VITESTHLLSAASGGATACIDFILHAKIAVFPSTEASLKRCRQLIEKYSGIPMDFADAALVVVAEELDTNLIFTIDDDFRVYRIHGRKRFQIVPEL
jgi:predicted nucleic acid-binding protein